MKAVCGRGRYVARASVALAIASAGVFALPSAALRAHAELVGCRSDPVVVLSNGAILDLGANITDAAGDVQNVAYTLHVPSGVRIVMSLNTTGLLGLKETFGAMADQPANQYSSLTKVTTGAPGVAVTATTTIIPLLDQTANGSASGQAQQDLVIRLTT